MGQVLQRDLLQGRELVGVAGLWEQKLVFTISWQRFWGFVESDRGKFDEEVLD